jgi:hypothetical protein
MFSAERMNRDLIELYENLVEESLQVKTAPTVRLDQKGREQIAGRGAVEKAAQ